MLRTANTLQRRVLRNDLLHDTLFITIIGVLCAFRIFLDGLPAGHDALATLFQIETFRPFYVWNDQAFCGYPFLLPTGGYCMEMLFSNVLTHASADPVTVVKLLMGVAFVGSGLSMYFLSRLFFTNRPARLISSLSYMFSQFLFTHLPYEGHIEYSLGYAFAPLLIMFFEKSLRSGSYRHSVIAGIFGAIYLSVVYPGNTILMSFLLLSYFVYRLFSPYKGTKRALSQGLISVCTVILLCAFWLLPYAILYPDADKPFRDFQYYSIYSLSFMNSMAINYEGATCCGPEYFSGLRSFGQYFGLWLPILALLGLLLRRDGTSRFFALVAVVSIFFAKGSNAPLGDQFEWCWRHIPGLEKVLGSVGEGEKFLSITSLAYCFLIGAAVCCVWSFCQKRKSSAVSEKEGDRWLLGGRLFIALVLCFIVLHSWYPIKGSFRTFRLPDDYTDTFANISQNIKDERILWYPVDPWARYPGITPTSIIAPGYSIAATMDVANFYGFASLQCPERTQDFADQLSQRVADGSTTDLGRMLGEVSVRYVVVDLRTVSTKDMEFFSHQEGLHEIIRNDSLLVFENSFCKPLIHADGQTQLSYTKNNPCDYTVHIEDATQPFVLAFGESYHPLWRAYVDGEEVKPIQADSPLTSFPIDRTGEFDIRIHFVAQDYANWGIVISVVSFIAILGYLVQSSVRHHET